MPYIKFLYGVLTQTGQLSDSVKRFYSKADTALIDLTPDLLSEPVLISFLQITDGTLTYSQCTSEMR